MSAEVRGPTPLYQSDFVAWAEQTAQLLKQRRFDELDLENLIAEVKDLSRRERQALYSNLKLVLLYLLQWQFQSQLRCQASENSIPWDAVITEHRQRIDRQLKEAPSLKPYLAEIYPECYLDARLLAAKETGQQLTVFPPHCPYGIAAVLDQSYLPDASDS